MNFKFFIECELKVVKVKKLSWAGFDLKKLTIQNSKLSHSLSMFTFQKQP